MKRRKMMKNKKLKIVLAVLGVSSAAAAALGYLIKKNDVLLNCEQQDMFNYDDIECE